MVVEPRVQQYYKIKNQEHLRIYFSNKIIDKLSLQWEPEHVRNKKMTFSSNFQKVQLAWDNAV